MLEYIIQIFQFSIIATKKCYEVYKETGKCAPYTGGKKQSTETNSEGAKMVDLEGKDLKAAIYKYVQITEGNHD